VLNCFKVGKTAVETHMFCEAYGNEACFALPQKSTTRTLMSESNAACFFDHRDIVQYQFVPEG
jgi:hypothetical protein